MDEGVSINSTSTLKISRVENMRWESMGCTLIHSLDLEREKMKSEREIFNFGFKKSKHFSLERYWYLKEPFKARRGGPIWVGTNMVGRGGSWTSLLGQGFGPIEQGQCIWPDRTVFCFLYTLYRRERTRYGLCA